ncbi:MAG: hypothetical protein ACAI25_09975 [Planctomycetota bacterium]
MKTLIRAASVLAVATLFSGCGAMKYRTGDVATVARWPLQQPTPAGAREVRPSVIVLHSVQGGARELASFDPTRKVETSGLFASVRDRSGPDDEKPDLVLSFDARSDSSVSPLVVPGLLTLGVIPFWGTDETTIEAVLVDANGARIGSWTRTDRVRIAFWMPFLPIDLVFGLAKLGGRFDHHTWGLVDQECVDNLVASLLLEIHESKILEGRRRTER